MLGNVYINKIHARQCLCIIRLYCREGFPILSISLLYPKESFTYNFKTARKKRFFNGATSSQVTMSTKSLVFSLIAMKQKILASIVLYIFRLFT